MMSDFFIVIGRGMVGLATAMGAVQQYPGMRLHYWDWKKSIPDATPEGQKSINFRRSATHGLGVLATPMMFWLQRMGIATFRLFSPKRRKLDLEYYSDTCVPTA